MERPFVHLGARSDHSFGESFARAERLCRAAARNRQQALALGDAMSLAAAPVFAAGAATAGIRPIFALDARIRPLGDLSAPPFDSVRLLATSETGWRRLVSIVNAGAANAGKGLPPHVNWSDILAAPDDLLYLLRGEDCLLTSGGAGRSFEQIEFLMAEILAAVPAEQLFIALPNPATRPGAKAAKLLQTIAEHYQLPLVAAPDVLCSFPEDDLVREFFSRASLAPIQSDSTFLDLIKPPEERKHLHSSELVRAVYKEYPQAVENAIDVAAMCRAELPASPRRFPRHEYQRGVDAESFIWNEVFSQASARYGDLPSRWRERLNREFHELADAGLADALVCLSRLDGDFREQGILRGPGAGFLTNSLIASLLGITCLDPLTFDLPFSLPESVQQRASLLELCVASARADEAARVLQKRFRGHLAPVARWKTWTTGSALEWILTQFDEKSPGSAAIQKTPQWQAAWQAPLPEGQDPPLQWKLAEPQALAWLTRRLEGRARAIKTIPGEWVFSAEPLARSVPCSPAADGTVAAQWNPETLAALGFGRITLKREPMLDLLDEGTAWARSQGRRDFDPYILALEDDPATFKLLREGRTQGVAPLQAPSVKMRLRQLQPSGMQSLTRGLNTGVDPARLNEAWFERILLAVACAALKAQEKPAFYAAALSQASGDHAQTTALLHEAAEAGIALRSVDINCSTWRWAPEGEALRPGFIAIREMKADAAREIEFTRRDMNFADLADLIKRSDRRALKTPQIESMIRAGALDSTGAARSTMLARLPQLDELLRPPPKRGTAGDPLQFFGQGTQWWLEHLLDEEQSRETADERLEWLVEQERLMTGITFTCDRLFFSERFLRSAHIAVPSQLRPRDRDEMRTLISPIYALEDPELKNTDLCLLDMGGCIVQAKGAPARAARRLALQGDYALVTGNLHRDQFQWVIEAEIIVGLRESARLAADAQSLEINLALVTQKEMKALLALFRKYKGNTPVRVTGLSAEKNRLADKIASRKITWCPGLEVALRQTIEPACWRLSIKGSAQKTKTPRRSDPKNNTWHQEMLA